MASFTNYKIDFAPEYTSHYWQVELVAWLIKKGNPEVGGRFDGLSIPGSDAVRAEFSLALTCPQFVKIRRGRSILQTWERLDNIFEHCGPASDAPLFRQVAHQCLDEKPEMKELLGKFLDEIEEGETRPINPSPLTVLRKLVTHPELFRYRKKVTCMLDPLRMLNGVKRVCGCNPYVPIDEIPERNESLSSCMYCTYNIPDSGTTEEDDSIVHEDIQTHDPAAASTDPRRIPYLKTELVSILKVTSTGRHIIFNKGEATTVSSTGDVEFRASPAGARFFRMELDGVRTQPADYADLATWHRRLGHIDFRDLLSGNKRLAYRGLKLLERSIHGSHSCRICQTVKLPGMPLRPAARPGTRVLQNVYADFCGPIPGRPKGTVLFFICFTDEASGWMAIYFLHHSTGILKSFKEYVTEVERQVKRKIRSLQSNDDLGNDFDSYLRARGIERRKIPTDTYHIRTLLETTKCLLLQSGLDDAFYCEALSTACYIRNRSSSARLDGLTPYQKWFGTPPSLGHMHEFGALVTCMATKDPKKGELETKQGRYLSFVQKSKAYKIWIPDYKKVVLSREVDFYEYINPQGGNDTRVERPGPSAGGTVERPSASNSDAGKTSGSEASAVIPDRTKTPNQPSRHRRKQSPPSHRGPPKRYDEDFTYYGARWNRYSNSRENNGDSVRHEEQIIHDVDESDAPGKGKDNNDVGEPTVTNKPVKASPEEQTTARPSAQSSAQPSAQPSAEGAGPRAIPRNMKHAQARKRAGSPPNSTRPTRSRKS